MTIKSLSQGLHTMLIICFLGIVITTAGTILLDRTFQNEGEPGFQIVAVVTVLLGLSGRFN